MTSLLEIDIPRTLDALVRDHAKPGTSLEAWVFEDELARRAAEAALADAGVRARIRSAYKPLLHFFLEEVELSGLTAITVRTPNHALAAEQRFRVEAYPLAGLLRGRVAAVQRVAVLIGAVVGFACIGLLLLDQALSMSEEGTLTNYLDLPEAPAVYLLAALAGIAALMALERLVIHLGGGADETEPRAPERIGGE